MWDEGERRPKWQEVETEFDVDLFGVVQTVDGPYAVGDSGSEGEDGSGSSNGDDAGSDDPQDANSDAGPTQQELLLLLAEGLDVTEVAAATAYEVDVIEETLVEIAGEVDVDASTFRDALSVDGTEARGSAGFSRCTRSWPGCSEPA